MRKSREGQTLVCSLEDGVKHYGLQVPPADADGAGFDTMNSPGTTLLLGSSNITYML